MISSEDLALLGHITKTHGLDGEVNVTLETDIDLSELPNVFIPIGGLYVPFFVESLRPRSATVDILKFSGVDTAEDANEICGHDVLGALSDLPSDYSDKGEGGYISDFMGYTLKNQDGDTIGEIHDYDDSTKNLIFIVKRSGMPDVYVPVSSDLLLNINIQSKTLTMIIPDGILDL